MTLTSPHAIVRNWELTDGLQLLELSHRPPVLSSPLQWHLPDQTAAEQKIIEWQLTSAQTKLGLFPVLDPKSQNLKGVLGLRPLFLDKKLHFEFCFYFAESSAELRVEAAKNYMTFAKAESGLTEIICILPKLEAKLSIASEFLSKLGMSFLQNSKVQGHPMDVYRA